MFHSLLRCWSVAKFLTIRERRRFESISSSWVKPKAHTYELGQRLALGNLSPCLRYCGSDPNRKAQGTVGSQVAQAMPAHGQSLSRRTCLLPSNDANLSLDPSPTRVTWLHGQNELSGRYVNGTFNLNQGPDNGTVLKRHRRDKSYNQGLHALLHLQIPIPPGLQLSIITWFISTITNIANHDKVATYISRNATTVSINFCQPNA
jgi:hypothetical protein